LQARRGDEPDMNARFPPGSAWLAHCPGIASAINPETSPVRRRTMFDMLKTAALSTMIGLGAITALPAAAQADSLHFSFGDRHDGGRIGIQFGSDRYDYRGWDDDDYRDRRTCSPDEALRKARRIGLRRARVVDVDRRTIDVVGRDRGDRVRVTFGRRGNCPILHI
jgi:hypothetical protein